MYDPVIDYVAWEYAASCTGFGDTTLVVSVSASDQDDPTGASLTYSGTISGCDDISIDSTPSPVEQTLNCFAGSLTQLSVTVEDPEENTDTIESMWESALCTSDCAEGDGTVPCPSD